LLLFKVDARTLFRRERHQSSLSAGALAHGPECVICAFERSNQPVPRDAVGTKIGVNPHVLRVPQATPTHVDALARRRLNGPERTVGAHHLPCRGRSAVFGVSCGHAARFSARLSR